MPTLSDVKEVLSKYLYLSNTGVIDTVLGAVIANQIPGPPICLYLVGPPGSGKTEILNGLEGYYRTYHPSKITPQTLLSGYIARGDKRKPADQSEKSLLVKLCAQGKNILVLKDFTTVLVMPSEARNNLIGQFREIADGRYTANYGTGEEVCWQGKMAFIAAVTNAIDEIGAVSSVLGERFLTFRMRGENLTDVYNRVVGATENLSRYHDEFRQVVSDFMLRFDIGCDVVPISPEVMDRLPHLAAFVAHARTGVSRTYRDEIVTPPEREGFGRISRQLQIFGSGVALAQDKTVIDMEVYRLIKKVARDTIPPWRHLLLRHVATHPEGLNTKELETAMDLPRSTLQRHLQDLTMAGVIFGLNQVIPGKHGLTKFLYLSVEVREHVEKSGVFIYDYVE